MAKCRLYQSHSTDEDTLDADVELSMNVSIDTTASCQHQCLSHSTSPAPDCKGDFTRCAIQLDDQQLSDFIEHESYARRVEFIFNARDSQGVLKVEHDRWLALELVRRFGKRQTQGIETTLTIKNYKFLFSSRNMPMVFGDAMVFPLFHVKDIQFKI